MGLCRVKKIQELKGGFSFGEIAFVFKDNINVSIFAKKDCNTFWIRKDKFGDFNKFLEEEVIKTKYFR